MVFFMIFMTGLKKVKWDRHSISIINFLGFIAIARHLNVNGGCSRSGKTVISAGVKMKRWP